MVVGLARLKGFKVQYWWKSIHSPAGFPDLYMVSPHAEFQIFLELKIKPDKPSVAQLEWINLLGQLPNTIAEVVYYEDWDRIVQILK
jgi:hypothetical protein